MEIKTLFFDVGGVLLTNGWDEAARKGAVAAFGLDPGRFEQHHRGLAPAFDTGALGLEDYLDRAVFDEPRSFTREAFKEYMFGCSRALPGALEWVAELAASGKFWMATLNNESLELNELRIRTFGLERYFQAFFSSCYLGLAKPDPALYQRALRISRRDPAQSVFIDDRAPNLVPARSCGMQALQCIHAAQARTALEELLSRQG